MHLGDPPAIVAHRCRRCGRQAFPPDPYGCERCGAPGDELEPIELAAVGTIHALATVHRHHHPRPETPFTVATIVIDGDAGGEGVTLKAVLAGDEAGARVGARVEGVVVAWETDEDDTEIVDLRFRVAEPRPDAAHEGGEG
jgi:uncharacterized OB-fold protein